MSEALRGAAAWQEPEKVAIELQLNSDAVDHLPGQVQTGLESVLAGLNSSGLLWNWSSFPVKLPQSAIVAGHQVTLNDLFQRPLQHNNPSELQRLNAGQLASARRTGSFEAASGVEGVPNVWTLTQLLVVGTQVLKQRRCLILATAFGIQRYSWGRLFFGGRLSIYGGLELIGSGVRLLVDLLFGWRWMEREHTDHAIDKTLLELVFQRSLVSLDGGGQLPECRKPDVKLPSEWKFTDAQGVHSVDLSFAYEGSDHQVHGDLRQKLAEADKAVQCRRRAEDSHSEPWLPMQEEALRGSTLPPILVPLFIATSALAASASELQRQEDEVRTAGEANIEAQYPIRKLCPEWRQREIRRRVAAWRKSLGGEVPFGLRADHVALERLRAHGLGIQRLLWWINILAHRISFHTSPDPVRLRAEMEAEYKPEKVVTFNFIIWRPRNWIINERKSVDGSLHYSADKQTTYEFTTRWPGWRLWMIVLVTLEAANNGCYWLVVSLLYGPLGAKALFSPRPFYPATKVNSTTGQLEVNWDIKVHTLCSRLLALCSAIAKSRQQFEARPDVGLLGKSITRICNLAWNYLFLGFIGITGLLIGQPALTLLNIPFCIVMIVTPMIWAPVCALLVHILCIVVYDAMEPHGGVHCFGLIQVICFLLLGGIHTGLALAAAIILPVANVIFVCLGLLLNLLRQLYDCFAFCLIIRRCARVPASDSFTARRTAGPGLSAGFSYQVSPAVALAALQQQLELLELELHEKRLYRLAEQPEQDFAEGVRRYVTAPLGLSEPSASTWRSRGGGDGAVLCHREYVRLQNDCQQRKNTIREAFSERRRKLERFHIVSNRHTIRQSRADLLRAEASGARVVKSFAEQRWLPLLSEAEKKEVWETQDLAENDWVGLARWLFAQAFSTQFMDMPLEDMDAGGFRLEVTHAGLQQLVDKVVAADDSVQDPLTTVTPQCPCTEGGGRHSSPDIWLKDILNAQPSLPLWALEKVYQRREGWGAQASSAATAETS